MHAIGWIGKAAPISCDVSTSQPDVIPEQAMSIKPQEAHGYHTFVLKHIYIHFHSKGHREVPDQEVCDIFLPSISVPLEKISQ